MIKVVENISQIDFKKPIQKSLVQATQLLRTSAIKNAPIKTGTLRRSITVDNKNIKNGIGKVGTNVIYARIQEYGGKTKYGGKIRARRYFQKAIESNKYKIYKIFKTNLLK